jgi:hypothetical protein
VHAVVVRATDELGVQHLTGRAGGERRVPGRVEGHPPVAGVEREGCGDRAAVELQEQHLRRQAADELAIDARTVLGVQPADRGLGRPLLPVQGAQLLVAVAAGHLAERHGAEPVELVARLAQVRSLVARPAVEVLLERPVQL